MATYRSEYCTLWQAANLSHTIVNLQHGANVPGCKRYQNLHLFWYGHSRGERGLELAGFAIELSVNGVEWPVYPDTTVLKGFAVEFVLNEEEKEVTETTIIKGFSLELIDYPFYSFEITEST